MNKIITISREFGSGGRELGKRLAESLGFAYYDQEIIKAISERNGLAEDYIERISERGVSFYYPITYARTFSRIPEAVKAQINVMSVQSEILKELAVKDNCVIVGRCADMILSEYQPLNLFVYADMESRIRRCRLREEKDNNLTDKELQKRIIEIDRSRSGYREIFTNMKWGDKRGYHLCINTTGQDIKALVPAVKEFVACYFSDR